MSSKRISAVGGEAPDLSDERKRSQIPIRTSSALRQALIDRAQAADRSLTQEIEQRLEMSIAIEAELGGPEALALFRSIAASVSAIGGFPSGWRSDVSGFAVVRTAAIRTLDAMQPTPAALMTQVMASFATSDEGQRKAAIASINKEVARLAEAHRKASAAANAAMDLAQGISADLRDGAAAGITAIERLLEEGAQ